MEALLLGAAAALLVVTGRLGAVGRLRRNVLVGIRTPATLRTPETWEAAHRAAGGTLVATGVLGILGAVAVGVWGDTHGRLAALALADAAVLLTGVVVAGVQGVRAARAVP